MRQVSKRPEPPWIQRTVDYATAAVVASVVWAAAAKVWATGATWAPAWSRPLVSIVGVLFGVLLLSGTAHRIASDISHSVQRRWPETMRRRWLKAVVVPVLGLVTAVLIYLPMFELTMTLALGDR